MLGSFSLQRRLFPESGLCASRPWRRFCSGVVAGITCAALTVAPLPLLSQVQAKAKPEAAPKGKDSRRTLLVLPLKVTGVVPRSVRERYVKITLKALQSDSYNTVLVKDCEEIACALEQAPDAQRPVVLRQVLSAKERNYSLFVELVDARTKRVLSTSKENCELCGVGEVSELFGARASVIKAKVESTSVFGSTLLVKSEPSGAQIYVDGKLSGVTPSTLRLPPGRHKVELRKKGRIPSRKSVAIVDGVKEMLEFELSEVPVARVEKPRLDDYSSRIPMRGWGWLAMSTGVLALGAGVPLVLLHKKPFKQRCDPASWDQDANGNCRYVYDTQTAGIVSLGVGGALFVTGLALAVIVPKVKERRHKKKLAVAPSASGLHLRF